MSNSAYFQCPRANDAGDRVTIIMNGKFLPYRYHGPKDGAAPLGYKSKA